MNRIRVMWVLAASCLAACSGSESAMAQYYGGYPSPGYGGYGGYSGYGGYGGPVYSSGVGLGVYGAGSSWGIGVPTGSYYGMSSLSSGYGYSGAGYGYSGPAYGSPYGYSGYAYRPSYGYGYGGRIPVYVAPAPVLGTTTTIIRGGPTGGVVQYSNNGNGYSYAPDSSYSAVVRQSPVVGPSRMYVVGGPKPVVIESRPSSTLPSNSPSLPRFSPSPPSTVSNIKLSCPKTAPGPLSYSLNGHIYTIQPGYSQTFPNDRAWTIEFKRGGDDSEVASLALNSGTYLFVAGPSGWDLQQPGATPTPLGDLPPAPLPPPPLPAP